LLDDVPLIRSILGGAGSGLAIGRPVGDRRIFRVAGQPWRYCGVTAFQLLDLFARGADIWPFVDVYLGLGFNTFRILCNKPPAASFPYWSTPPLDVAVEFARSMAAAGAWVELTLFGSKVDSSFVPAWIEALRSEPNVLVEGMNEPGHDGQYDETAPIDALVLPRCGDLPYATGNYDPYKPMRGSYATVHTDRDDPCSTARKAKAVLEMYDGWSAAQASKRLANLRLPQRPTLFDAYAGFPVPWVGDEPAKPQDISYRVDCFLALFAIYGMFGAGGTFHTLGGQFGQLPDERETACAQAAIQGLTAFPPSTPIDYHYGHDYNDEAASGSLRTYRAGPYGVRVCPTVAGYPILIGV
jgi:hypothetical protein